MRPGDGNILSKSSGGSGTHGVAVHLEGAMTMVIDPATRKQIGMRARIFCRGCILADLSGTMVECFSTTPEVAKHLAGHVAHFDLTAEKAEAAVEAAAAFFGS